jgi:hypothetical protein
MKLRVLNFCLSFIKERTTHVSLLMLKKLLIARVLMEVYQHEKALKKEINLKAYTLFQKGTVRITTLKTNGD